MVKTDLTDMNGVSRSLIHSKLTNKLRRQQKALQILSQENINQKDTNYRWEMRKAGNILSALAQGKDLYGFNREEVLSVCKSVGFTTGFFSINVGDGEHHYILQESGNVINVSADDAFTSTDIIYPSR